MQSTRHTLYALNIGDQAIEIVQGSLLVVERSASTEPEWELVVHTAAPHPVAPGTHLATMTCVDIVDPDSSEPTVCLYRLAGSAFLVRNVNQTVVLRGDGRLTRLDS